MAFAWSALGLFSVFVTLVLFALACVVVAANPSRRQVKFLALLLLVDGIIVLGDNGIISLTENGRIAYASQGMAQVFLLFDPFVYLLFIGTLPSRFARPMGSPKGHSILGIGLLGIGALFFLAPDFFIRGIIPGSHTALDAEPGPGFFLSLVAVLLSNIAGLVIGIHAWRTAAPGSQQRRQLGMIAIAFGVRDAIFLASIVATLALGAAGALNETALFVTSAVQPPVNLLIFALLLTYAVLRAQVFDIDLKIKAGAGRTIALGIVTVLFFVLNEVAEAWVPVGGIGPGLVVAGVLAALFYPLQRLAIRFLDGAFPGTRDTPEYREDRKADVYAAAVEETFVDGSVTEKERRILERLRDHLGMSAKEAGHIEARWIASRMARMSAA